MSYDEHLISMAGGDGDELDQIQWRINDCQSYKFGMRNADKLAHEDAPYLLALVREQQAKLDAVRAELVHAQMNEHALDPGGAGAFGARVPAVRIADVRAALERTP